MSAVTSDVCCYDWHGTKLIILKLFSEFVEQIWY